MDNKAAIFLVVMLVPFMVPIWGYAQGGVPADGLIAYWKFNESSGMTAADSSGSSATGTLINGPAWVAGKRANALQFNATDNGIDNDDPRVSLGTNFNVSLPFTISAWVNPASYADYRAIFSKRNFYTTSGMRFDWTLTQGNGRVFIGAQASNRLFTYAPPLNTWTHLAVVLTSSATVLYVNGVQQQSMGPISLGTHTTASTVMGGTGEAANGDNDPFKGSIDELRIYNRALSAQENLDVYNDTGTVDTQSPSAPAGLAAGANSDTQINLSWTASTDNVGVTGYAIYRDGAPIGITTATSYQNAGLTPDTTYSYRVSARDAAGNESVLCTAVSATTLAPDAAAPVISAVMASNITSSGAIITWITNEPADSQVQYGLTQAYGSQTTLNHSAVTAHSQTLSGLAAGTTYDYRILSRDAAGNLATSTNFIFATIVLSNQAPTANAGIDRNIVLPEVINLTGAASDDGLPNPPTTLTTTWSLVSGPGTAVFGNAGALHTTATFSAAGTYTLRLTVSDSLLTAVDDVVVSASASTGTALGNLAASMQPGTWAYLESNNINPVLTHVGISGTILGYAEYIKWDPVGRRLYFAGGDHNDDPVPINAKHVRYDEATNSWTELPTQSWFATPPGLGIHGQDHGALDPVGRYFYFRPMNSLTVYRYHLDTGVWSAPPHNNVVIYNSCCVGIDYFPELNGVLWMGTENGNYAGITRLNDATGVWDRVAPVAYTVGGYHSFVEYNPVHKVMLFGGGSGTFTRKIYKLDATGVVTPLRDSPVNLEREESIVTVDPVSGKYLIATIDKEFYEYDIIQDVWTLIGSGNSIPIWTSYTGWPLNGVVAGVVNTHGVNVFVSCDGPDDCKMHLYKHTSSGPDETAPSIPTGLTASAVSSSKIHLSWNASTDNVAAAGYGIERCDGAACTVFALIATPASNSYSDIGLSANTTYSYKVRAVDAAGNLSGYSNVATMATPVPDDTAPTISAIAASAITSLAATITWITDEPSDTQVQYGLTQSYGSQTALSPSMVTAHSQSLTGLQAGTLYHYQVKSKDANGNLAISPNYTFTTGSPAPLDTVAPSVPAGLFGTAVSASQINLSWNASTDNIGVTGYRVWRNGLQIATTTATSFSNTGLLPNTLYSYSISAYDAAANECVQSASAQATTLAPVPGGDITSGLVAYWSFDEGSGTTASDSIGTHPGTLTNNSTWIAGRINNALHFNATDNGNDNDDPRVRIGTSFNVAVPLTISAWINPENYGDYRAIFSKRNAYSASAQRFDWSMNMGNGTVNFGQQSSSVTFSFSPPTNTWTHLAVVATSSGTSLYVNGVLHQNLPAVSLGSGNTANTVIGGTGEGAGGDNDPFKGAIDDLRVYNRALVAADVQALFQVQ